MAGEIEIISDKQTKEIEKNWPNGVIEEDFVLEYFL